MFDEGVSRFTRVEQLLGTPAMQRLAESRVAVIGVGAVGSFAIEALARSGVGMFRLVDFDVIHKSNFNRQLHATQSSLGKLKVQAARDRIKEINPICDVEAGEMFIDETTVDKAIEGRWDVIIDAIDSVGPKCTLIRAANDAGIPIISAMGAATRTTPGSVRVADLWETRNCPLARMIRKKLRRWNKQATALCIYSIEPARYPTSDEFEAEPAKDDAGDVRGRPRSPLGSLCALPGMFGLMVAHEAIKVLLGDLWVEN